MKRILFPVEGSDSEWWVVVPDLLLAEGRLRGVRPIHILLFVGSNIASVDRRRDFFSLGMNLESKLAGTLICLDSLRGAVARKGDPGNEDKYVRDYSDHQAVATALEGYLGAIYTVLETVAEINRLLRPGMPRGFRRQSRKEPAFSFELREWLPIFYDIRSHVGHFGSVMPVLSEDKLLINFESCNALEVFERASYSVPIEEVYAFYPKLYQVLDGWATPLLETVDPTFEWDVADQPGPNRRPVIRKMPTRDLLRLVGIDNVIT